jgi:uncharacterized protein (TIGR03437 family)
MSNITQPNTSINRCRKSVGYPNFTPIIYGASVTTSVSGVYTLVYITGENFISPVNGTTYVNFGSFTELPIVYYSSFNISFVVPKNALPDNYNIVVVNLYNGNFNINLNNSNPGILNYSNSITYTIT